MASIIKWVIIFPCHQVLNFWIHAEKEKVKPLNQPPEWVCGMRSVGSPLPCRLMTEMAARFYFYFLTGCLFLHSQAVLKILPHFNAFPVPVSQILHTSLYTQSIYLVVPLVSRVWIQDRGGWRPAVSLPPSQSSLGSTALPGPHRDLECVCTVLSSISLCGVCARRCVSFYHPC